MSQEVKPIVVRPTPARKMLGGCSKPSLWKLINAGKLDSYLDGHARLITVASIEQYIADKVKAARK